jgi:hypothetical protein
LGHLSVTLSPFACKSSRNIKKTVCQLVTDEMTFLFSAVICHFIFQLKYCVFLPFILSLHKNSMYHVIVKVFDPLEQEYDVIEEFVENLEKYEKFINKYYTTHEFIKKVKIKCENKDNIERDPRSSSTITCYGIKRNTLRSKQTASNGSSITYKLSHTDSLVISTIKTAC